MSDWILKTPENVPLHVVPLDDLREHVVDKNQTCWCKPVKEDFVIVHNSADGREQYETRQRKPH